VLKLEGYEKIVSNAFVTLKAINSSESLHYKIRQSVLVHIEV